ncbi:MAG: hypothetical protein DI535_02420 [Citrobacter freundii]|nr:MAG: hypothetical protein DI535_02420 [Citrobacter freundii]
MPPNALLCKKIERMETRMAVDKNNEITEMVIPDYRPKNKIIRAVAVVLSYVFHPLFIPVYMLWLLLNTQAFMFGQFSTGEKILALVRFFIMYSFFPLVTVLLAKGLGFLQSIYLRTQKERIIPYIASNLYYFWMCYVLRHQQEFPKEAVYLSMAIFIASCAGLMANIYMKVSMHAMAMGIMVGFVGMMALGEASNYTIYFSIALLVAGMVCTSRMIVSDHTPAQIYTGLLIGVLSIGVAIWADGILP